MQRIGLALARLGAGIAFIPRQHSAGVLQQPFLGIALIQAREYAAKPGKGGDKPVKQAKISKAAKPAEGKKDAKIAKIAKVAKRDEDMEEEEDISEEELRKQAALVTKIEDLTEEELRSRQKLSGGVVQHKYIPLASSWSIKSQRVGAIAVKCGMMTVEDEWGARHGVTVLQLQNNQVIQVKTDAKEKYTALQVGCSDVLAHKVTKPMLEHFAKAGVPPKRKLFEFRVTQDAILPPGTRITARHFIPDQLLDVTGISKGKGFAGGMKRWGFAGLPATHGVSVSHRSLGATGQRQDPGRVFKGKKMPGHMGVEQVTTQNLKLLKIDVKRDLLFVVGAVPGPIKGFVRVRDALKSRFSHTLPPPFPTFVAPASETPETMPDELIGEAGPDTLGSEMDED